MGEKYNQDTHGAEQGPTQWTDDELRALIAEGEAQNLVNRITELEREAEEKRKMEGK